MCSCCGWSVTFAASKFESGRINSSNIQIQFNILLPPPTPPPPPPPPSYPPKKEEHFQFNINYKAVHCNSLPLSSITITTTTPFSLLPLQEIPITIFFHFFKTQIHLVIITYQKESWRKLGLLQLPWLQLLQLLSLVLLLQSKPKSLMRSKFFSFFSF